MKTHASRKKTHSGENDQQKKFTASHGCEIPDKNDCFETISNTVSYTRLPFHLNSLLPSASGHFDSAYSQTALRHWDG